MIPVDLYLQVRAREGRLYPDAMAARLPHVPAGHPLAAEWRLRAASCARLAHHLEKLARPLGILDAGCGNGWLANQMARLPATSLCGTDRARLELAQAQRLFARPNLVFLEADISNPPFHSRAFDVILLASVIQYFPDLPALIRSLLPLLAPQGELHLLDSPLYTPTQLPAARQRTREYYTALGFPEMAEGYHHHTASALAEFSPQWLHQPHSPGARWARLLRRATSPFPWICFKSRQN